MLAGDVGMRRRMCKAFERCCSSMTHLVSRGAAALSMVQACGGVSESQINHNACCGWCAEACGTAWS